MNIVVVVGTRPNFIKAIPVWNALLKKVPKKYLHFLHTGQHYSHNLSDVFLKELEVKESDVTYLATDTNPYPKNDSKEAYSWILKNANIFFETNKIQRVIVFGDVDSTLAVATAAMLRKLHIIHIESGLRSFDMEMPEERNRVLVDKMSNQLFVTELSAIDNLNKEGIYKNIEACGNTMIDTLVKYRKKFTESSHYKKYNLVPRKYVVLTLHRQENVENIKLLIKIMTFIKKLADNTEIVFPLHPRTKKALEKNNIVTGKIKIIEPQSYLEMINLVNHCGILITDSGGLQEESSYLGVPCITIRKNTERPITVTNGYNFIVPPANKDFEIDFNEIFNEHYGKRRKNDDLIEEMGKGDASEKIIKIILYNINECHSSC